MHACYAYGGTSLTYGDGATSQLLHALNTCSRTAPADGRGSSMDQGTGRSTFFLVIALLLVIGGGAVASLVHRDFGSVRVTNVRFAVLDDGMELPL